MWVAVFLALPLLSGVSQPKEKSDGPVEINNPRVLVHRIGPEEALHQRQQEATKFSKRPFELQGQCLFEVVVSSAGIVESLRTLESNYPCEPYQDESAKIIRGRTYKPWFVDGVPAQVKIKDWVNVYPPERRGPPMPFPEKVDLTSVQIRLERTACFGTCPVYVVTIDSSGAVTFDGQRFLLLPGHHTAQIPQTAVASLIEQFRVADFLSALPVYKAAITDNATQTVTLQINGTIKSVVDYVGLAVGLPFSVHNLEDAIDQAAGTERWILGNSETLASLQAEHWDFSAFTPDNIALYRTAIDINEPTLIAAFLSAKAPVVDTPDSAIAPICKASQVANLPLVREMLKQVKTVPQNVRNRCLSEAAKSGSLPMVDFWLAKGADPKGPIAFDPKHDKDWTAGFGPLFGAVLSGAPEVVHRLLQFKMDVNQQVRGESLLEWAIDLGAPFDADTVRLLLHAGADPQAVAYNGETVLKRAQRTGCRPCADLIQSAIEKRRTKSTN